MNTLKKRQEHGQLQQQKASEIWDKQTDSRSQRGRSHWYIIWIDLHNDDRNYETEKLKSKPD
jgi:hypothetical protein